jgi:DNA-binding MarR family transcriptional regulator
MQPDIAKTRVTKREVATRWTANLARAGWTPIADFFLDNYHRLAPPLKYSEAMFVIHLMRHKWDAAAPYPGFNTIAKRMGLSPEGARLLARKLEKKGYLYRQMQVGQTNKFHLDSLFAALEKLLAADQIARANEHRKTQPQTASPALGQQVLQPPTAPPASLATADTS